MLYERPACPIGFDGVTGTISPRIRVIICEVFILFLIVTFCVNSKTSSYAVDGPLSALSAKLLYGRPARPIDFDVGDVRKPQVTSTCCTMQNLGIVVP